MSEDLKKEQNGKANKHKIIKHKTMEWIKGSERIPSVDLPTGLIIVAKYYGYATNLILMERPPQTAKKWCRIVPLQPILYLVIGEEGWQHIEWLDESEEKEKGAINAKRWHDSGTFQAACFALSQILETKNNKEGVNTIGEINAFQDLLKAQGYAILPCEHREDILQELGEKEVMIQSFQKVQQLFEGRSWIMKGRGCYPYDDDNYKKEVRAMYDEFTTIKKDTWNHISTHVSDYQKRIIEAYVDQQSKSIEEEMLAAALEHINCCNSLEQAKEYSKKYLKLYQENIKHRNNE